MCGCRDTTCHTQGPSVPANRADRKINPQRKPAPYSVFMHFFLAGRSPFDFRLCCKKYTPCLPVSPLTASPLRGLNSYTRSGKSIPPCAHKPNFPRGSPSPRAPPTPLPLCNTLSAMPMSMTYPSAKVSIVLLRKIHSLRHILKKLTPAACFRGSRRGCPGPLNMLRSILGWFEETSVRLLLIFSSFDSHFTC